MEAEVVGDGKLESEAAAERKRTGGEDKCAALAESVGFGEQHARATVTGDRDAAFGKGEANGFALVNGGR